MRVALVMARGIEGCGVSKFTVEMAKYLEKRGHTPVVIASKDKTWTRKKSHEIPHLNELKFAEDSSIDKVADLCNACDLVVINSLPPYAYKKGLSYDLNVAKNFRVMLEKIKAPIVMFQHDHNKISITRNDCLKEAIEKSKMMFAHSPTGDFVNVVKSMLEADGIMGLFGEVKEPNVQNFQPGMYFDDVRAKYWKPIAQTDKNIHRWIGRMTLWKGPRLMLDFHNQYLRNIGSLTVLEGIEKSLAYVELKNKYEFHYFKTLNPNKVDNTPWYGNLAIVFANYKNEEMLERMSKGGYGYQLSLIESRYIKHSIEYTHCEVVAAGVIPVFRKEYGDACIHIKQGVPLTQCKDTGTIWLSEDNKQECFDLVQKLNTDDGLRDEWREKAYDFYKSHQDADSTFDRAFNLIKDVA